MHDTQQLADPYYAEPLDELPSRPRRRLLTPLTVALMLALFAACGFVGGVLVQKGQSSSPTVLGSSSVASRLGAAASGASGPAGAAASGRGGFASRLGGLFGSGGASLGTAGTVTNVDGSKLFVTTTAGTMTEVVMTPDSKVTKSESVGRSSIHPGDSIVVSGITGSNGAVTAATITDSGSSAGGAAGSGVGSLFGGGSSSSGATSSSGGTSLFGG